MVFELLTNNPYLSNREIGRRLGFDKNTVKTDRDAITAAAKTALQYLSKAKRTIERIIKAMDRYLPVELRWKDEMGTTKLQLEMLVEELKQRIRDLRQSGARSGGGGRGFGTGGG